MHFFLEKGIRLLTKDKVCREDIEISPVLQDKTITENGIYTADAGYIGLDRVTVEIPESSGNVSGGVENPILPKLGRLKYFEDGRTTLRYKDVYMCNFPDTEDLVSIDTLTGSREDISSAYQAVYSDDFSYMPDTNPKKFFLNTDANHGYISTHLCALWLDINNDFASIHDIYTPRCKCKIIRADPFETELRETEIDILPYSFDALGIRVVGSACIALNEMRIECNTNGGYVVSVEFVYPKSDIVFSTTSAGWQYAVKDDIPKNLSPIMNGTEVKGVEEIYIYNNTGHNGTITCATGETFQLLDGTGMWVSATTFTGAETVVLS